MTSQVIAASVVSALDNAAKKLGNDARTAEALNMPRGNLSDVRTGKRALTIDQVATLSQIIDCNPQELLAANELHRVKDKKERTRLERVFFSFSALGVVATLLLFGATVGTTEALAHAIDYVNPIHISAHRRLLNGFYEASRSVVRAIRRVWPSTSIQFA